MISGKTRSRFLSSSESKSKTFPWFRSQSEYKKFQKKAKKINELDEDNKKLRSLLKVHIENSEKLRIETQTTVETLREEFDLLVKVGLYIALIFSGAEKLPEKGSDG